MRIHLLFFFFLFITPSLTAQQFLQLEKVNSLKVKRFYIGDELTFQLEDEYGNKYWRTEVIERILVEEGILIFPKGKVNLKDILAIRTYNSRQFGNKAALSLYTFGAGWILYSLIDAAFGGTLTWSVAIVSGTAFATGFIIKQIFKQRTFKMGKKRRLRVLDLTFKKELGP